MSRVAAEKCLEALYAGCIMLNPGLDVDYWIDLAYTGNPIVSTLKNVKPPISPAETIESLEEQISTLKVRAKALEANKGLDPAVDEKIKFFIVRAILLQVPQF